MLLGCLRLFYFWCLPAPFLSFSFSKKSIYSFQGSQNISLAKTVTVSFSAIFRPIWRLSRMYEPETIVRKLLAKIFQVTMLFWCSSAKNRRKFSPSPKNECNGLKKTVKFYEICNFFADSYTSSYTVEGCDFWDYFGRWNFAQMENGVCIPALILSDVNFFWTCRIFYGASHIIADLLRQNNSYPILDNLYEK
jgi:hypothetical protein